MSAARKIQDQIVGDNFTFGLWGDCPEDVPVAWGARAIADRGCGFSLLPDRQTWAGPEPLRKAFSKLMNAGPLARAVEEAKRLRDGWTPFRDLAENAFKEYWYKRLREEPELFESFLASGMLVEPPNLYPHDKAPKEANPLMLRESLLREDARVKAFDKEWERKQLAGEEDPPPDPPHACDNEYDEDEEEGEDCGQKFTKVGGEWQGCYFDFDAWVCESCGHHNYVDEDEDDEGAPPKTPYLDAYRNIVGQQTWHMKDDEGELFTLYDDHFITIKGNTNGSYGYVYLIAYPKHTSELVEKSIWSGVKPIPMPGDTVTITRPEIGRALVLSHLVEHDHLHLITIPEGRLPEFWYDQNTDRLFPPAPTWNVMGREIGEEVERANDG